MRVAEPQSNPTFVVETNVDTTTLWISSVTSAKAKRGLYLDKSLPYSAARAVSLVQESP